VRPPNHSVTAYWDRAPRARPLGSCKCARLFHCFCTNLCQAYPLPSSLLIQSLLPASSLHPIHPYRFLALDISCLSLALVYCQVSVHSNLLFPCLAAQACSTWRRWVISHQLDSTSEKAGIVLLPFLLGFHQTTAWSTLQLQFTTARICLESIRSVFSRSSPPTTPQLSHRRFITRVLITRDPLRYRADLIVVVPNPPCT
jgi:hypothetical protein